FFFAEDGDRYGGLTARLDSLRKGEARLDVDAMRAEEATAIVAVAYAIAVDVFHQVEGPLVVARHLHESIAAADAAREVDGGRGAVEEVAPVVVAHQYSPCSVAAGGCPSVDVRRGVSLKARILALETPVPVDLSRVGRCQRPCVRAEHDLVGRREVHGNGTEGRVGSKRVELVQAGLVEDPCQRGRWKDGVRGSRVVEPPACDGTAAELARVAHDAAIVGLAIDAVPAPVPKPERVSQLMHEGPSLLVGSAPGMADTVDGRRDEASECDDRIIPADFPAAGAVGA